MDKTKIPQIVAVMVTHSNMMTTALTEGVRREFFKRVVGGHGGGGVVKTDQIALKLLELIDLLSEENI